MPNASRLLRGSILGTLAALAATAAPAQSTEAEVTARLKGKPLYFRGSWVDDKLNFSADGTPLKPSKSLPFTEAGFDFQSAKWTGNQIIITGQRVAVGFDGKGREKRIKLRTADYDGRMALTLQAPSGEDCGKTLDAIFADGLADLTPSLPNYWQTYARAHFLPAGNPPAPLAKGLNMDVAETGAQRVGGAVKPPKVLKSVEPGFTDVARALKFSGAVQVYLWIDENGVPSHLKIAKPAGLGLD